MVTERRLLSRPWLVRPAARSWWPLTAPRISASAYSKESPFPVSRLGGEWRLCLPQVLNTVLRDFTLQQINAMCDQLYVYCSRCDASQLHVLKVTGVLPPGAPSCGLITLTDAQRLCNALLQPGDAATDHDAAEEGEGKEVKDAEGFWVEHQCLGKCQGLFVPRLYAAPNLPCIRCAQCRALFSPKRFVMHSHHQPDKRTCHWGFDSAKWACYLQLGRKHLGAAEEPEFQQLLERMKEKFHGVHTAEAKLAEGAGKPKVGFDLGPVKDRLCGAESGEKAAPPPVFALGSHLHPGIKGDPRHLDIIRHSFYLYMQERLNESAVSPSPGKHAGPLNANVLHDLLSQADKRQDENAAVQKTHVATELQSPSGSAAQSQQERPGDEQPESVSIETSQNKRDVGVEKASRDSVVMEVLQLYRIQHEKLLSTLQRQQQLEKELEALRGGEVASCGGLLEAGQTEHAQRLWEEKRKTVSRVKQTSRHKADDGECQGESRYVTELLELRRRLDRAEEDREELQEELRREREAREMLERTIGELQQQMKGPVPLGSSISPAPSPNNDSQGPSTP
uniref:c-SKI SMAD4-binding domain-containing protein n=1 Tax=Denticeps clupeoides TaxID=299321 RepID=A0AAY4F162_9TELE